MLRRTTGRSGDRDERQALRA